MFESVGINIHRTKNIMHFMLAKSPRAITLFIPMLHSQDGKHWGQLFFSLCDNCSGFSICRHCLLTLGTRIVYIAFLLLKEWCAFTIPSGSPRASSAVSAAWCSPSFLRRCSSCFAATVPHTAPLLSWWMAKLSSSDFTYVCFSYAFGWKP